MVGGDGLANTDNRITHSAALSQLERLHDYLESQENTLICDKLMNNVTKDTRSSIAKEEQIAKRQTILTDFFNTFPAGGSRVAPTAPARSGGSTGEGERSIVVYTSMGSSHS